MGLQSVRMCGLIFGLLILLTSTDAHSKVVGKTGGLHPSLRANLSAMSRHFGRTVKVVSGCRMPAHNRKVRGRARSYHLTTKGCRAADIRIKGVKKTSILRYWGRRVGGGRGYYCRRGFVHVDIGPKRSWTVGCGRKRKSSTKRKK